MFLPVLFLLVLIWGGFSASSTAQDYAERPIDSRSIADLQADEDILWMGIVELDYAPDYSPSYRFTILDEKQKTYAFEIGHLDESRIIKLQPKFRDRKEELFRIGDVEDKVTLMDYLTDPAAVEMAYEDPELKERIGNKYLIAQYMRDTLQAYINGEWHNQAYNANDIRYYAKAIRVRQVLYYSRKELAFKTHLLAVAPLAIYTDHTTEKNIRKVKPIYWLAPAQIQERARLDNNNLTWARRFYKRCPLSDIQPLKETLPLAALIDQSVVDFERHEEHLYIGGPSYPAADKKIKNYDWQALKQDTFLLYNTGFDPESFGEQPIYVTSVRFSGKEQTHLLLIQEFYWDVVRKQLGAWQVGFGYTIGDGVDDADYYKTYFIRYPHRDRQEKYLQYKNEQAIDEVLRYFKDRE